MARTVTFLLTEIVDSVRQWESDESGMASATDRLDDVVRATVARHSGTQVKPRGEGDSHFLTFDDPLEAVKCAVELQRALADEPLLAVRSGCHIGAAEFRGGDWYGTTVNRCARLRAAAHARQSLVSADVAALVGPLLPADTALRSLGRHRLKDLDEPTEIFQVCAPRLIEEHPPLATMLHSHGLALPRSLFVGRTRERDYVAALLQQRRVVTVTGAPGVGTSRFALEAAAQWWETNGCPVRVAAEPVTPVDGELVVVPDAVAPGIRAVELGGPVIVVARGPLGIANEHVARLSPLDPFDAETLLCDRLAEGTSLPPAIASWCDGLPLALELLARRAGAVGADDLAQRLATDPLAVLGGDRRAEPPRHASLRATLRDAFDALGDDVRAALLAGEAGTERLIAAGWDEPTGRLPLVARFVCEMQASV